MFAPSRTRQWGFSLVELTVVLLLITLLASVAVRETSELAFQTRYEQTKERLEMIKQAILGNPKQIINGQQAISGFVADMGRLPVNLRELIDNSVPHSDCDLNPVVDLDGDADPAHDVCRPLANGNCYNSASDWLPFYNQPSCTANNAGNIWKPNVGNLAVGWNGPYLTVSGNPADNDVLTDGWGNISDNLFYGWAFCLGNNPDIATPATCYSPTNTTVGRSQLSLVSSGQNQTVSNADTGYDEDYPTQQPIVSWQDWLINLTQRGVNLNFLVPYGGLCNFPATPAVTNTPAGCVLVGGTWNAVTSTCSGSTSVVTNALCTDQGGHWGNCQFTPDHCTTATANGGLGLSWRQQCEFSQPVCTRLGGSWSGTAGACTFTTETQCINYGGTWNAALSTCALERNQCESLDGTWVRECEFTQTACTGSGRTWNPNTSRCEFTAAACTASGGTPPASGDCQITHDPSNGARFTQASCFIATNSSSAWTFRSIPTCLNISYRDGNHSIQSIISQDVLIREDGLSHITRFDFPADTFSNDVLMPIGQNAVVLLEADDDCDNDNLIYPSDRQSPLQVDFHPHTALPVINW